MDHFKVIGRALPQLDYNLYTTIKRQVMPMLENDQLIQQIRDHIFKGDAFTGQDTYMKTVYFVGSVYEMYCPGSFFVKSIMKLRLGVRDQISRVLSFKNPEMVNYYH